MTGDVPVLVSRIERTTSLLRIVCGALRSVRIDPPSWPSAAFLLAAAQVVLGAVPAYGLAGSGAALPMLPSFGVTWVPVLASVPVAGHAYRTFMTPLVAELGLLPIELRVGVRIGIERADTVTGGVTIGRTHVVSHVRRHAPYSAGSRNQVAIPVRTITGVGITNLPQAELWLTLADGTPTLALPGSAIVLTTPHGTWHVPTDHASEIAGVIGARLGAQ